jgi:IclR family acetate operon transcriptional repressor
MSLDPRYVVIPVHKSMQLLDVLVANRTPMTLSDLAARTALPKTTAFRYLYTLRAARFVEYDEQTERYSIGARVAVAPPLPDRAQQIRELLHPALRRLQRQFNETVNLAIRDGQEIVYIDIVGSTRLQHAEASIGKRDPLYSTALGKAFLIGLRADEIARVVPERIEARTPHTITDRDRFFDEIARSARRRYALDLEENELGACCVATPIPSSETGEPIAAISISGPSDLMSMETLDQMGRVLNRTVNGLRVDVPLQ